MHLSKINKISFTLLWVLTILPISVLAAGLGQLNVLSALGEPLKADIELLSVSTSEMATLKARVAPASAYAAQGLARPASHNDIKVNIAKRSNGKKFLKLHSNQAITEPFLDMLIEVEWENGRILKEYTALLDPPGYDRDVIAAQVQAPEIKSIDNKTTKVVGTTKAKQPSKKATKSAVATRKPAEDYLTRRGDTLSKIAKRMKPEGVSLDQMLVGLVEANPEAFVGKNMNRLKVGKILQSPTAETLNAITQKQARKKVLTQTANWKKYRRKLAEMVESSVAEADSADTQASSGKIQTATEDQSAPKDSGPKDVVKLSTGETNPAEADMQAKITSLQEEVSAREKGLLDAQDRIGALEKQIEDMHKLLTLKNDALTKAQNSEVAVAAVEEASETQMEAAPEVAESPEVPEPAAEKAEAEPAVEAEVVADKKVVAPAPKPAAPAKPVAPKPANTPAEQPSFFAGLLDTFSGVLGNISSTIMAAAAGLIGLLVAAWFYLRHKRRKNLADFEQGIMTSGGLKANTVFGNTSGTSLDTGDTSFLTDFSQSTTGGMIDTNDVDPIAEAEVYMAYGRDAQAEEILKDAISKEPKRYELHLKLLEMYAASKNTPAFETVSGELYTTLGAEDPTWAKVAAIGAKLEPNNPLYQISESAAVASAEDDATTELDASDFEDAPMAKESDLDFSLGEELPDANTSPKENDLGAVTVAATAAAGVAVAGLTGGAEASQEDLLDMDVQDDILSADNVAEVVNVDNSALDFDLKESNDAPAVETPAAEILDEASFKQTMPNLDLPEMAAEAVPADAEETAATLDAATLDMPDDLTFNMPEVADEVASLEGAVQSDVASSEDALGFDVDGLATDTVNLETNNSASELVVDSSANELDLSELSLDVDGDGSVSDNALASEVEVEPMEVISEAESPEVDTKLELVTAYIDMDDKEGAKELLDEVLKEGGTNQRKRAEELLATLA